jgi:hypothetical protein
MRKGIPDTGIPPLCLPLRVHEKISMQFWALRPRRQGVKTPEYMNIPSSCASSRTGCIGVQKVTLFYSEPLPNAQHLLCRRRMRPLKTISVSRTPLVGAQMLFVAFGALVLAPLLTGLDPNVALFTAGAGTLLFQTVTKRMVPVFLASSFAFIAPIIYGVQTWGIPPTLCGLAAAGLVYITVILIVSHTSMVALALSLTVFSAKDF